MSKRLMIAALALAMVAPSASAQVATESTPVVCANPYVVRSGDSLWRIAETQWSNPQLWQRLQELNPVLNDPSRVTRRENGWVYVLIEPGERLCGVNQNGEISLPGFTAANTVPVNVVIREKIVIREKTFAEKVGEFITSNWWWLLALLAGMVALFWLFRQTRKDPVHSGPAMVQGGVTDASVRQEFEQRGFRQNFTILDTVRGRASGILMVSYANGQSHPRQLNSEPAYRATVRHHDGRIEDLYMLQGCGNDLRYGGIWRYVPGNNFRFEVEENIPEAPPAVQPVPNTAPVVPPVSQDADAAPMVEDDTIKIELKGPGGEYGTAMVRITGAPVEGMTIDIGPRSFIMRWNPDADSAEG